MTKCKEPGSTGENDKVKCVHIQYLPIPINNRYDVSLHLRDYPSSKVDVAIQENKLVKKNQKTCHDTRKTQTGHNTKHCTGEPGNVMNQYGQIPVNIQEDYTKPKNIPTIINGQSV
jgi:hypothetical protein